MSVHPQFRACARSVRVISTRIFALLALFSLASLSACSGLPSSAPTAPALLPTRTLAPLRTVAPTAVTVTTSPKPTSPAVVITDTAVPTVSSGLSTCKTQKPDPGQLDTATTSTNPGRIAYVTTDGNIALTDPAGKSIQLVTTDANTTDDKNLLRIYTYPTFSGDGKSLAFVAYTTISGTDLVSQTLYVSPAAQKAPLVKLYTTSQDNIPYVDWSPDGKTLAFLTLSSDNGAMRTISPTGGASSVVEQGSTAYWNWRADSAAVLTHMSGSPASNADAHISIVDAATNAPKRLSSLPGNFKAPQYSPGGTYTLYVARISYNDFLVLADNSGKPICAVASLDTGASFAWSPDGSSIAWIDSTITTSDPAPLYLYSLSGGTRAQLHDSAVAFFWSPDSKRIAVYSIVNDGTPTEFGDPTALSSTTAPTSTPMLRIEIVDADGTGILRVADTYPTRGFIDVLGFFDQYARAVTPWSPDSLHLVFTSASHVRPTVDMVVASLDSTGTQATLKYLTSGVVAFWSPR